VIARGVTGVALVVLAALGVAFQPWVFVAVVAFALLGLVVFELWAYRQAQLAAA